MSKQIEVMDADKTSNQAAMHSVMVMEQWGGGETYDEATWIERGRHAVRQTMEGMLELGRALIILKEHTEHGRFMEIVKKSIWISYCRNITPDVRNQTLCHTPNAKSRTQVNGLG